MLAPAEALERLRRQEAALRADAAALARHGARKQRDLSRRLAGLEAQKKQVKTRRRASS